ncbi:MAG: hypothetical protein Q9183_003726 [Haloplaca sp. 2 TL-2023]
MAITKLPNEILARIFEKVDDLDETRRLSHVCRLLRGIYQLHQSRIDASVISKSDVYSYDRELNAWEFWVEDLRVRSRQHCIALPVEHRQDAATVLEAIRRQPYRQICPVDVAMIRRRWQTFGSLRRLYTNLLPDFDRARNGESGVTGLVKHTTLSLVRSLPDKLDEEGQALAPFDKHFKKEFHRTLCLLAISMAKQHIGLTAQWSSLEHLQKFAKEADLAWTKRIEQTRLGNGCHGDALQSIEVDDFLYRYLAPVLTETFLDYDRILPNGQSMVHYLYLLYPSEIAECFERETWKAGSQPPWNQMNWVLERGMAEPHLSPVLWCLPFCREKMVEMFGAIPIGRTVETGNAKILYYDGYRKHTGSPFSKTRKRPVMTRAISLPVLLPEEGRCDEKDGKVDPGRPLV